jgi:uncharacterized protein YjdB
MVKKIVAAVAAISMMISGFSAYATVEDMTQWPTDAKFTSTVSPLDVDTYNEWTEEELTADKYDFYKVSVNMVGVGTIGNTNVGTAKKPKYTGKNVNLASFELTFDHPEYVFQTESMVSDESLYDGYFGDIDQSTWTEGKFVVASTSVFPGTDFSLTFDNEIEDAFVLYFAVDKGKAVNVNVGTPEIGVATYTSSSIDDGGSKVYSYANKPADCSAEGFKIGTEKEDPVLDKVVISGATSTDLTVGDEVTLTAKAYNNDETENTAAAITWAVEGDAVTVDNGLVKAVKEGTATVTATAVDGDITKSASVTFTVENEKLPALPEVTVDGGDVAGQQVKSGENTIGYLWKAIFNAATIKDKYVATFKSGSETNAATLKGFDAQNIEGEGNVSVIVALNTAKAAVTLGITDIAE